MLGLLSGILGRSRCVGVVLWIYYSFMYIYCNVDNLLLFFKSASGGPSHCGLGAC